MVTSCPSESSGLTRLPVPAIQCPRLLLAVAGCPPRWFSLDARRRKEGLLVEAQRRTPLPSSSSALAEPVAAERAPRHGSESEAGANLSAGEDALEGAAHDDEGDGEGGCEAWGEGRGRGRR